ncbi:hypothetical protein HYV10_02125, partial [Candidatus Dependentiae bacterium]|nr:hypothetical protein [Candidatus Dependentiae bacterium]
IFMFFLLSGLVGEISASDYWENKCRKACNKADKKAFKQERTFYRNQKEARNGELDPRSNSTRVAYLDEIVRGSTKRK